MSLNQFDQAVSINIQSNLIKQLLIVLPHAIAGVTLVAFLDLKGVITFFFLISLVCVFLSLIYFVRLHLTLNSKKSILKIHFKAQDSWYLTLKNDIRVKVTILATSFSSNLLIILNFKDVTGRQYTALITPDGINPDEFRRLKVLIKTYRLDV